MKWVKPVNFASSEACARGIHDMSQLDLRRLLRTGLMVLPGLGVACSQMPVAQNSPPGPMSMLPHSPVDPAMGIAPVSTSSSSIRLASATSTPSAPESLPISLDTVLRLAEQQNPQVAIARAKVCSAFAEKRLAAASWLPNASMGVGYYRHDGGIQDQNGTLINSDTNALNLGVHLSAEYNPREYAFKQVDAARKIWQNQGELSKITYEQLVDASTTYIDFLAACSALAISMDFEAKIKPSYEEVLKHFNMEGGPTAEYTIERPRIEAEMDYQQNVQKKLRGQINALSAKLCYLLGLDPHTQLVPVDTQMVALNLIDARQSVDNMVAQAVTNGPGIHELDGILCVINSGVETARGPGRFAPIIGFEATEGAFAANGLGTNFDFANRSDIGVEAKWNISDLLLAHKKRDVAMNQICQVNLTVQELRAKLTMGVHEAKSTIDAAESAFPTSEKLITEAKEIVKQVKLVLENPPPTKVGEAPRVIVTDYEVVAANRNVMERQLNYVDIMREYNKAQLRLMVLLGGGSPSSCEPVK
jgi:hypothetical protein